MYYHERQHITGVNRARVFYFYPLFILFIEIVQRYLSGYIPYHCSIELMGNEKAKLGVKAQKRAISSEVIAIPNGGLGFVIRTLLQVRDNVVVIQEFGSHQIDHDHMEFAFVQIARPTAHLQIATAFSFLFGWTPSPGGGA